MLQCVEKKHAYPLMAVSTIISIHCAHIPSMRIPPRGPLQVALSGNRMAKSPWQQSEAA